jgi:hypothetical protein
MIILIKPIKSLVIAYHVEVRPSLSASPSLSYPATTSLFETFKIISTKLPRKEDHQIGWIHTTGIQLEDFYLESAFDLRERFPDYTRFTNHLKTIIAGLMHFKPKGDPSGAVR